MCDINKTFIGVVKEINGNVSYTKIQIPRHSEFLAELNDMMENPNRTVLDMQSHFDRYFSATPSGYNYCAYYSSSYVSGVSRPATITFDEYQKQLDDAKEKAASCYDENDNDFMRQEAMESAAFELARNLKGKFYSQSVDYITAHDYVCKLNILKGESDIKMISTALIGWASHHYDITRDIRACVSTNFGYGYSSYFFLTLTYKGVDIIPFSYWVKYPYAHMSDIRRCTRSYYPDAKYWDLCLDFTASAANLAKQGEGKFFDKFLVHEIEEMMGGLRRINTSPEDSIKVLLNNDYSGNSYSFVRAFSRDEMSEYKLHPNEFTFMNKVHKLSGALAFLEDLQNIQGFYSKVLDYIDEIKAINRELLPQINQFIGRLSDEIQNRTIESNKLKGQIETKQSEINTLNVLIKPFEDELRLMVEAVLMEKETYYEEKTRIETEYINANPKFSDLRDAKKTIVTEKDMLLNEKSKIDADIRYRKNLIVTLNDSKIDIKTLAA